jgi:HK97 family phage major capsid protein
MRSNPVRGAIRYSAPLSTPAAIMHARPPHKVAQIAPPPAPAVPAAPAVREFKTFADYLRAVVAAANGEGVDRRLQRAPTGLSEGLPADGGWLVPEVWAEGWVSSIYSTGQIARLADRKTTTRPLADVELPAIDETSRADGSRFGGVLAYWSSEAASQSSSFPRWRRVGFTGRKIIGIGYATSEMMADSDLFEGALREAFAQELAFALDHCVLVGSGAGQPAGVVSAPCTISVAKETGQAAATIVAANVVNMYDRLVADCRANAVWFVNPDCDPQLRNLALVVGTAGAPLWSWNADASPYPRLLGLPCIPTEHNAALGTVGDIVLADLSQYRIVDQTPKDAVSFDAAFVSDQVIFRMVYRVDAKPKYASPITPANSSTTRSPFITLATRA